MNISKFFIDRPIFAGVLSVLIFLAGLLALRVMPISEYPEVAPPSVVVRAQYPGANPKVIAETVATPMEEAINGVEGMLYMASQATTDGLMTLTVTFKLGTDLDKAQQLVQNRVSQAEPRLPEEVRRLGVTTVKSAPDLTMVVHLLSPNDRYDMTLPAQLRGAERQGPAGAHRRRRPGAAVRSRRLLHARLARPAEDRRAVACRPATSSTRSARRTCRPRPAWSAHRPACRTSTCSSRSTPSGRLQTEEEFGDIVVKAGANGEVTRLRDVARIELGASEYALRSLLDNKPAVAMPIFQAPGSNAIAISDNVRKVMAELKSAHARGRRLRDRLRPDAVRARLHRGRRAYPAGGRGAGGAGGDRLPADLARLHHSAGRGADVDRSARSP